MTSSRSRASTSSWGGLAVIVAVLWCGAGSALADKKRVVVLDFEGEKAEKFHDAVVRVIRKSHAVVATEKWYAAAEEMSAERVSDRNVKKVARKLAVDGVVEGKVEKRRDEYILRIKLRSGSTGEVIKPVNTTADNPRLEGAAQRDLKDELIAAISELDEIRNGTIVEDDDEPVAKKKPARADDDEEDDDDARPARKKKPARADDEEEDDDARPARKKKPARADDDEPVAKKKPAKADDDEDDELEDDRPTRKSGFSKGGLDKKGGDAVKDEPVAKKKPARADDDEPVAKKKPARADDDEPVAKKKPARADDDEGEEARPAGKKKKSDAALAIKADDDDPPPARPKQPARAAAADDDDEPPPRSKQVAARGDDDEAIEEDVELGESRGGAAQSPGTRAIDGGVGFSFMARRLTFQADGDLPAGAGIGEGRPANYKGLPVPGALVDLTIYPLAFGGKRDGLLKNLGATVMFDRALAISSEDPAGAKLPTTMQRYAVGAAFRYPLGSGATAPVIGATVRYGRQKFQIRGNVDIPNVNYTIIDPTVFFRYPLSRKLTVNLDAGVMVFGGTGAIQRADQYGGASVLGFEVAPGAEYRVTGSLFARAALRFETIKLKFKGEGALTTDRDDDMAVDVQGVRDSYYGATVTVGYLY